MATIKRVKKRNGNVVDFDQKKIVTALQKAFLAVAGAYNENKVNQMVDEIVGEMEAVFGDRAPGVEDVQDAVERRLMAEGFFAVAKAYILYRYEHEKLREEKKEEVIEKIERHELLITKRNGVKEPFYVDKIKKTLSYVARGYEDVLDIDVIAQQCRTELYEGISTDEIARALTMTVRSMIERDPAYSKVAARLLLHRIYKSVIGADEIDFGRLDVQYREAFVRNITKGVQEGKFDQRLLEFDLVSLSRLLAPERDELLMYLGVATLYDRYFVRIGQKKDVIETPQTLWLRVAMGLSVLEKEKAVVVKKFYEALSTLRFISSTPTLFHAGTPHPQLSSCYLNTVKDDLAHIFKVYGDNAQLSKWAGGIGTDWTNIRATGALIKKAGIRSQGIIPFLKIANDVTVAINRSGRRRGATCVYLETWHADIEDFLELRKNTGDERRRTHDMNTANWVPDLFMKRVRDNGTWTLFSPDEVPELHDLYGKAFEEKYAVYEQKAKDGEINLARTMKARDLWKKMLGMLFETGHPWITFKDPSNIRSPQDHVGVVHNSNLCTEITLNTSEKETAVCNLGSVNMAKHITDGKLNEELIKDTVLTAMRMLDNVVDINFYPTEEARAANMRHRPVGLGIMGFQDALYLMDISFDSEACVAFADRSMEVVSYYAILGSSLLAKERGAYESYKGSKWDRGLFPLDTINLVDQERGTKIDVARVETMEWRIVRDHVKQYGMRNSNTMAIAPTATISNIAGSVPTIEPIYKNIYVKSNISGDFTIVNHYLVKDLKRLRLWDDEMLGKIKYHDGNIQNITEIPETLRNKYKEVFQIDQRWLIRSAAYRGKWVDQSQSLNIYFAGTSGKEINDLYMYAWEMGLKTTYYLRTLAATQVEKSTVDTTKYGSTHLRKKEGETEAASPVATPQLETAQPLPQVMPVLQSSVVQTAAAQTAVAAVAGAGENAPKLCKILDPDCEACQ